MAKKTYKVQCDLTGAIVDASRCRMTHDGLFVLKEAWYPRHPQDSVLLIEETRTPAIARPEGIDVFIDSTDVIRSEL